LYKRFQLLNRISLILNTLSLHHNGGWFGIRHINKAVRSTIPLFSGAIQTGQPSMNNGDGSGHCWGRIDELCVVVCPATRTGSILAGQLDALAVNMPGMD